MNIRKPPDLITFPILLSYCELPDPTLSLLPRGNFCPEFCVYCSFDF